MTTTFKRSRVDSYVRIPIGVDDALAQFLSDTLSRHADAINDTLFDVTSVAASQSINHDVALCSTGASNLLVTLPPAKLTTDKVMYIKKVDAGVGKVLINPDGAETIDGVTTYTVSSQWQCAAIVSNGAAWFDLNR